MITSVFIEEFEQRGFVHSDEISGLKLSKQTDEKKDYLYVTADKEENVMEITHVIKVEDVVKSIRIYGSYEEFEAKFILPGYDPKPS